MYYTDSNGQMHGPFDAQADGFPNAGQVVRYYRKLRGFSALYVANELGNITERRVLQMESMNDVPDSITRRRAICTLLSIPPALLGLSGSIEDNPTKDVKSVQNDKVDLDLQKEMLPIIWANYHAGATEEGTIGHVNRTIGKLLTVETDEAYKLLSGYYRLVSRLHRDRVEYTLAQKAVIQSEHHALRAKDNYLYSNALLTHGRTLVEIGQTERSIQYFKKVCALTRDDQTGTYGTSAIEHAMALSRIATSMEERQEIDRLIKDSYNSAKRVKEDKSHTLLNSGVLALYRVDVALQLHSNSGIEDAIQEASVLMPPSHTYRHGLLNVYQSQYALVTGELYACLASANTAYDTASTIGSQYQIGLLRDIAHTLAKSTYATNKEVKKYTSRFLA